jgi:hypothetical protein
MPQITIDRESKSYVLEDGSKIPIPKESQREILKTAQQRKLSEETRKGLEKTYEGGEGALGVASRKGKGIVREIPETLLEYGKAGWETFKGEGPGQENMGLIERLTDNFLGIRGGRKQFERGQEQQHPVASTIGNVASIPTNVLSTGALPGVAALPLFSQLESEKSILEPGAALENMTGPALVGGLLDLLFKGVGKIAGNRGAQQSANAANIAETEGANAANAAEQVRYKSEIQAAKKNQGLATAAEKARFETETKAAQALGSQEKAAQEAALASHQAQQQALRQSFVETGKNAYPKLAQILGREAVAAEAMGVESFLDNVVNASQYAATKEGNRVSKFLKTVFKADVEGKINSDRLVKGLTALDETIAKETGPVKELLSQYKEQALKSFPEKVANQLAYSKYAPKIVKSLEPKIESAVVDVMKDNHHIISIFKEDLGADYFTRLSQSLRSEIENIFSANRANFQEAISNGLIAGEIEQAIQNNSVYQELLFEMEKRSKFGHAHTKGFKPEQIYGPAWTSLEQKVAELPSKISAQAEAPLSKYAQDVYIAGQQQSAKASKILQGLEVEPAAIPAPVPSPSQVPQVAPFTPPPLANVTPPSTRNPNLVDVASMPESQGVLGKLATGLESINLGKLKQSLSGQNLLGTGSLGILAKLAGVPVGKGVAAATGGLAALKGITSPGAAGQAVRSGLEATARVLSVVGAQAQQYASYRNGILDDPMDRRSLVKEIEDNPNMSLADKAMAQTQVNRGIPLQ